MKSKGGGEAVESALDRAVEHIVANADAQAAEEGGIDEILGDEVRAVLFGEAGDDALAGGFIELHCTFDRHLAAFEVEAGQALEGGKNAGVITWFGFHQTGNHRAQFCIIQAAVGLAEPEQAACGGGGDFGDFHEAGNECGKSSFDLGEGVLVDAFLVVRGEHFAGDLGGGDGDEAAEFAFEFGAEAVAVRFGGGFGFREDVLSHGDGLLRFLFAEGVGTFFRFVDQADGFVIGFGDSGGRRLLGFCELFFDALELFLALGDADAALFEHRLDWSEGEFLQDENDDNEVDHLRNKKRPIQPEGLLDRFKDAGVCGNGFGGGGGKQGDHGWEN